MQALQLNLGPAAPNFANFVANVPAISEDWTYYMGHAPPWWDDARLVASAFFASVDWGSGDVTNFDLDAPVPKSALRVSPSV
jgi:hypothetical protein